MLLEAKNLSFRYNKGRQILNDFSLSLYSGDRAGLSAPSGFGKTTLCKLLAGYLKADGGQVLLDGRELSSYKGYCPVQLIGQHPELALNPRLKMAESLKDSGAPNPGILTELGIKDEWLDRYPPELSGGELQRFCIARALSPKTKFILADEITAMLDLISQAKIWHFLLEKAEADNIGLLVVSHSEALLEKLCNRRIPILLERRS